MADLTATAADLPAASATRALRIAQCRTLVLLFLGYASCYFCRSNLSVATPLIVEELGRRGISHATAIIAIGSMASWGVFAYALGKCFLTPLGDYWGGKRNLLIATGGATLFTLIFAASSTLPLFTMAWIANRMVQSIGWSALIKVSSKWFSYLRYGTVAAILTCSYMLGDAVARQCMGLLLEHGAGWRTLFVFGASIAGLVFLANLVFLRESRVEQGHPEALANPKNVFSAEPLAPTSFLTLVMPLLRSRAFLIVCLLNFGATMVRETFNSWTPVYLHDFVGYTFSHAASLSAIFPGVGAISVLLCGWASDRLGPNTRTLLLVGGLAATAAALLLLTSMHSSLLGAIVPVMVIGLVAFCLLGPYSFLPGAFALDFGGKQAGAAASGLVDGTGYLGGVLAGWAMAQISVSYGWGGVFVTLAVVSALGALGATYLYFLTAQSKQRA